MKKLNLKPVALFFLCAALAASLVSAAEGVVNINTATEQQLVLLPRVGPALAKRIIDFRGANEGFKSSEELILVRGIGDRTFDDIEPFVVVTGETTLKEKVRANPSPDREED